MFAKYISQFEIEIAPTKDEEGNPLNERNLRDMGYKPLIHGFVPRYRKIKDPVRSYVDTANKIICETIDRSELV